MKKILYLLCLLLLVGCSTHKQSQTTYPPVILNNSDSVRVEIVKEIVYVPMEVNVDLPKQSETNVTPNDSSHVETDLAFSNAWIKDGILHHDITNKEGSLTGNVYVPQTTEKSNKEAVKEKEIPVPTPYPVEVERKITTWEQIKLGTFWYFVGALAVSMGYIFRKPLFTTMRKIIRL